MRGAFNLFLAVTILVMASCNLTENYSKPYLELSDSSPYTLKITDFSWGYGMSVIGQYNGDFETLNRKVYNILKGKEGTCEVLLEVKTTDKYGKKSSDFSDIGTINLTELNKFENYEYWGKDGGILKLIVQSNKSPTLYISGSGTLTSKVSVADSLENDTPHRDTVKRKKYNTVKMYNFPEDKLYPSEEDRASLNQNQSAVNGVITDLNFDVGMDGIMKIASDDGETYTVIFHPFDASSATHSELLLALKTGRRIRSICAIAGASTLDLVSAKITSQP